MSKEVFMHKRGSEGDLLPVDIDVEIEGKKQKLKILPLTKGDITKLQSEMTGNVTTVEQDQQLITKHIIEPKFEADDIKFLKLQAYKVLVEAILIASGVDKEKLEEANKNILEQTNPN